MPSKFHAPAAAGQSLVSLLASIRPLWPMVTGIEVSRAKRGGTWDLLGTYEITHIEGQNDPEPDVDTAMAYCKDDARHLGAGHRYQLMFRGTVPGRGKKPAEHNAELHKWTERFGDPDSSADDNTMIGAATNFMKAVPGIYDGASTTSAKVLELAATSQTMLLNQLASVMLDNERLRARQHEANEFLFRKAELEINATTAERQERRQDMNEARQAEQDTRRAQAEQAYHLGMIREGKELASMFLSMWQISKGFVPAQPPPPPGVDPSDGTIVGDLRVLLTNINSEEKAQIKEILGHDLWHMILAASRASDDDGAKAVLEGMMRFIKQNPSLAGNLFAAGKIIEGPRWAALISILKRGGAIT